MSQRYVEWHPWWALVVTNYMGCSDHVPSLDFFFLFLEDQSHFFNILILLLLYVCACMHVSTRVYIGAQGEVREQLCGVDFLVSSFYIGSRLSGFHGKQSHLTDSDIFLNFYLLFLNSARTNFCTEENIWCNFTLKLFNYLKLANSSY